MKIGIETRPLSYVRVCVPVFARWGPRGSDIDKNAFGISEESIAEIYGSGRKYKSDYVPRIFLLSWGCDRNFL